MTRRVDRLPDDAFPLLEAPGGTCVIYARGQVDRHKPLDPRMTIWVQQARPRFDGDEGALETLLGSALAMMHNTRWTRVS